MNIKKNLYKTAFTLISLFIFVYSLYNMYYRAERIYWAFACDIVTPLLIIIGILGLFYTRMTDHGAYLEYKCCKKGNVSCITITVPKEK